MSGLSRTQTVVVCGLHADISLDRGMEEKIKREWEGKKGREREGEVEREREMETLREKNHMPSSVCFPGAVVSLGKRGGGEVKWKQSGVAGEQTPLLHPPPFSPL